MANPTLNYGWQMPTPTDLVTDLPADFEVFGQAVDTSLLGLKGGTTGQVLSKTSGTDMAFTWATDASGIPATIVDAKGDLIAATAADAVSRLGVGANDTILTADSTTATGLKWAAAASGAAFSGCLLYRTTSLSIANATQTTVTWDAEIYDTDAYHSTSVNTGRITIPSGKTGYYLVFANVQVNCTAAAAVESYITGNVTVLDGYNPTNNAFKSSWTRSKVVYLTAADYFTLEIHQNSGGNADLVINQDYSTLGITYLGA